LLHMVYTLMSAIYNRILYRTAKSPIKYFENEEKNVSYEG